jgi:spore photoproduct lyase
VKWYQNKTVSRLVSHRLLIDKRVSESPVVEAIRLRLDQPAEVVEDITDVYHMVSTSKDPVQTGKEILFLTLNRGEFIRRCPGTRGYTCCGYKILHIGSFCNLDCSYCILQSYFHPPLLQYFVNYSDLFTSLDNSLSENHIQRFGTGEFTDSLIWEPWTNLSQQLIPRFARQSRAVMELKTKTTHIEGLRALEHNRKTIIAWSLNTDPIIDTEERETATLSERLKSAAMCEEWGYPIAFHFDPMVIYDGCEADYNKVVDQLFSMVSPGNIVWISLGAFRFIPTLKALIQDRFPQSKIPYGEFIPGKDGKMRYFQPLRIDLFRAVISRIREWAPNVLVYLCMEDDNVWQKSVGFIPVEKGGLSAMLDSSAAFVCGLKLK